ncbi:MAG: hypothetical protein AABZ17_02650 [Nitrospirota bacterium]
MRSRVLADTLRSLRIQPYLPGLNPVEHRWGNLREKPIHNWIFSSIDVLEIHFESLMAGT